MAREKTSDELRAEADVLEARALQNEEYMRAMERTTERTGGKLGHLNNPSTYAAHRAAAADKRAQAAKLRADADEISGPERVAEMRAIRERHGLTQEKFAGQLGITGNQVARIERGESGVSEPVIRLARLIASQKPQ